MVQETELTLAGWCADMPGLWICPAAYTAYDHILQTTTWHSSLYPVMEMFDFVRVPQGAKRTAMSCVDFEVQKSL